MVVFVLKATVFLADHLRKSATGTSVQIPEGHRFRLDKLRHSFSSWMLNNAKVEPKTIQRIQRPSRIQTTLDLYTQQDAEQTLAAQGQFLEALWRPVAVVVS